MKVLFFIKKVNIELNKVEKYVHYIFKMMKNSYL